MKKIYDVIIVGGGPAGLTAAIYLARARCKVLVLEKSQVGGQIAITDAIVNYPGIERISGKELTETMCRQIKSFGAEVEYAEVTAIDAENYTKVVHSTGGDFYCYGILLATGAYPRMAGFDGEDEFRGRGVGYCATCDGEFFKDKEVFVIGGGYAAAEESVYLTKFARHVTILIRDDDFSCAEAVANEARINEKITVLTNTVMEEVRGQFGIKYVRYKNNKTGKVTEYRAEGNESVGVFVFAGYAPDTQFLNGIVELDKNGYIITDESKKTNMEGVFAAGDVCIKPLRQVVTATSDAAFAATELEKYVSAIKGKMKNTEINNEIFTDEMLAKMKEIFEKMEKGVILSLRLDDREISKELEEYITEMCKLTDKLTVEIKDRSLSSDIAPCVELLRVDGSKTGLAFHGVPGGHELESFLLGIYNVAGPGQSLDESTQKRISGLNMPLDIKVLVTLSCPMCPALVIAAQHIVAKKPGATAHVYDIRHFDELRNKYNVMSVPCLVLNDEKISFGRKNINELLDFIEK